MGRAAGTEPEVGHIDLYITLKHAPENYKMVRYSPFSNLLLDILMKSDEKHLSNAKTKQLRVFGNSFKSNISESSISGFGPCKTESVSINPHKIA